MAASIQDPTPCPTAKLPGSRRMSTLAQDVTYTDDYTRSFKDAKPRRPGRNRKSMAWDPTVDIYDDTFAFQKPSLPASQQPQQQHENQSSIQSTGARRSTLLGAPAQRISASIERPLHQSSRAESQSVALAQRPEETQEIKKEPRRRTIFVPSENTTIMTVHPGQSFRGSNPSKRPRQSDAFIPISEERDQPTLQVTGEPMIRKPPRKSLAAAPKRAPLQNRSNLAQQTIYEIDVPGSGTGKENVPPGGISVMEKNAKRKSMMAPTVNMSRPRVSILPDETLDLSRPQKQIQHNSEFHRPHVSSQSVQLTHAQKSGSPPYVKSSLQSGPAKTFQSQPSASNVSFSTSSITSRRSSAVRRTSKLPEKLSMPRVGLYQISESFPHVSDDISKPELYEDDWLSHQEAAISNLINTLFDAASNRAQPPNANPRSKILSLYQEPSMPLLYKRLQASLRFGGLSISQDTLRQVARFKDDIGQKQRFLNFWLKTYNLESLKLVAEVVVGREVPALNRTSEPTSPAGRLRKQTKILESFITTFIIRNDDKAKSRSTTIGALGAGQDESQIEAIAHGWRRSVLRSLMMILLLDKAKSEGILRGNLFQTSSTLKSSSAVLRALCALLVPSIGDTSRVLAHLGYEVLHAQEPLEEHEYRVNNIAVDLRDGVLLTKLVEDMLYPSTTFDPQNQQVTLTLPDGDVLASKLEVSEKRSWPLRQHLKYPAVGRTVLLYNVQIALSALKTVEDAQNIIDNIKAEDIVDGHREKTVSLLWNLLSRWGLDALVDIGLLNKEIDRLQKELILNGDSIPANAIVVQSEPTWSGTKSADLLKLWAQCATTLHGVDIVNLSTSFSNGRAFKALLKEYTVRSEGQDVSISRTLGELGCSQAFINLFDGAPVMPTARTTIPLLAFLASRLLPAAQPLIAARKIQRAWRRNRSRLVFRQRLALARIAHGCAVVVAARESIVWAAQVFQRRWRAILDQRWAEDRNLPSCTTHFIMPS